MRELIYKKGLLKIDKQRVPLTDNNIIEQVLDIILLNFGLSFMSFFIHNFLILSPYNFIFLAGLGKV